MMEIESASNFLANLLRFENRHVKIARVDMFRHTLEDLLKHHYQHHWFPEKPCKGSGYRCLRINHKMDPLIAKAGDVCGFNEADLRKLLPNELTMWIDPQEVSYRIGENGSICVLYDGSKAQYNSPEAYQEFPAITMQYVQPHPVQHPAERFPVTPGCKESVRNNNRWDAFTTSPRSGMVEHFAAFVSS